MRTHEAQKVIEREYNGLPLRDAERDIQVAVLPEDLEKAERSDKLDHYTNCALAEAVKRAYGSETVAFLGTLAYADMPDGEGGREILRFMYSSEAREAVEAFDAGEEADTNVYITLRAPVPSERLDKKAEYQKSYQKRRKNGTATVSGHIRNVSVEPDIRNGRGKVQMCLED